MCHATWTELDQRLEIHSCEFVGGEERRFPLASNTYIGSTEQEGRVHIILIGTELT